MPDATITSTASTFGTISGVFSADQSTISGTISGIVPGTLTGSVGVPGPAGPAGIGLPAGGTSGQFLQKTSGVDYATDWVTVNLTGLATESWVTAGFYPLTGNPSSFLTASALTPYLTSATAASTYQTLAGMSDYLAKAGNLAGLANTGTARTNLGLGSLAVVNDAPSDGSQYARKNGAWDVVTTTPDYITSVSSPLSVTSGNLTIDLSAYAPLASPAFTGNPTAPTATFGDNDTSLATTAFVQSALAGGTAVARNLEVEVRNQSGSTIAAGSIVYISGATGNKPLITLAQANNDANSAQTIGFVKTAIANNGTGYVIVRGELENIDTSALTEGVQLYLSPTTAGTWTTTKPSAPQHLVYVGIVIRSHPTLGVILVAVQNGYELNELHDVAIGTLANNNLLAYESSTDLWKNKTYSALGLLTSADAASTYAAKTGATFTGDVLVSASPDVSTLSAGLLALVGSGSTNGMTLSTVAGYPQIYFNGPTGTSTQTVAYPGPSGFLLKADNLSGLANTGTARTNLGLGTMATATAADYSTTTVANGLYYPLSSNPAGYLTSAPVTSVAGRTGAITLAVADVSGAAPLASPSLTGTPLSTTAAVDTNTTQIATTAFVVGQAGSATPLVNGTAAVGTSLRYARQDHVHPTDTTRAALNSPTFSGTPSLPTGTIGVTQTAGNNTTALATTAFVTTADNLKANLASPALTGTPTAPTATAGTNTTQIATTAFVTSAVPAAATHTQALQFSSTSAFTKVIDASSQLIAPSVLKVWPSPSNYNGTATSGAGASAVLYLTGYILTSPSAGVAGNARAFHGNVSGDLAGMLWGGTNASTINFSRRVSMAFRFAQFPSSTASVTRVLLGKIHGTAVGDLTSRGIGVKYVPNGANFDFQLQVHNGTTLTSVTSSTQYAGGVADLEVVSDGAGNATLYLNGASVATTTGAPTGQTGANATVFAEIESTASTANQPSATIGRLYVNSLNF
jgi:hypothetical protein